MTPALNDASRQLALDYPKLHRHAMSLHRDLGVAVEAAAAAGEVLRDGFGKFHTITKKGIGDFVSAVDCTADQAVCEILTADSDTAILSEELHPDLEEGVKDFWIVDPLDATSAFLMQAGRQYPAVLIAKYEDGRPVLGVGYFPLIGQWFYGYRQLGAYRDGQRLKIAGESSELQEVWVEMNQYGDSAFETEDFAKLRDRLRTADGARMVTTTVPNSGVALRVAEGETGLAAAIHDNRPEKIKQAPWDVAPVKLILEEAGGVFVNLNGDPIDPFTAEVSIIARDKKLADQIISLLS